MIITDYDAQFLYDNADKNDSGHVRFAFSTEEMSNICLLRHWLAQKGKNITGESEEHWTVTGTDSEHYFFCVHTDMTWDEFVQLGHARIEQGITNAPCISPAVASLINKLHVLLGLSLGAMTGSDPDVTADVAAQVRECLEAVPGEA